MDPISEGVDASIGHLDRQTRLARATRPGQGYQPALPQKLHQLIAFSLATDKAGDLCRQIVFSGIEGAQRWEVGRYARRDQLEQPLGTLKVLQAMLAEIAQRGFRPSSRPSPL